jgi:hypothetical protein
MLTKIKTTFEAWLPWLFKDTMPVWLTIVVSISAAYATYVFAPAYNRQFVIEDVRSSHLTKTTDQLNADMIDLSQSIRRLNGHIVNKSDESIEQREKSLDIITKIQWRLVDIRVILASRKDKKFVTQYAKDLSDLKMALDSPNDANYLLRVRNVMGKLARSSQAVLSRLYYRSSIKETV